VLELKASEDPHLPLQALDYWIRVNWHREHDHFAPNGYFAGMPLANQAPRMLLIAPALDFHPTTDRVLSFFSPTIEVERVGLGAEWRREVKVMFRRKGANAQ
jgi:hypothetical protein